MDRSRRRSTFPLPHSLLLPLPRGPSASSASSSRNENGPQQPQNNLHTRDQDSQQERPRKRPRPALPASRSSLPPSPRTYQETVALYEPLEKDDMHLDGVQRLSCMALRSARCALARGKIRDLSKVADQYVYELLSGKETTPNILRKLEMLNPSRGAVFEALWARQVREKHGITELPSTFKWWREFFEFQLEREQMRLERASAKLRKQYSIAEERSGRKMETTRRIGLGVRKRRRGVGPRNAPLSRLEKLREEVRREKGKK